MSSIKIQVELDSFNKIYREGETMTGTVDIYSSANSNYEHVTAILTGQYTVKNNKVTPSQSHVIKFFTKRVKLAENGKLQVDKTNSFALKIPIISNSTENPLVETYQGVLVTIAYELVINYSEIKISDPIKIHVFVPGQGMRDELKSRIIPYEFEIKPSTIEKVKIENTKIPNFALKCKVDNTNVDIGKELNGWIKVLLCEIPIKSLELQFVRNEKVNLPTGESLNEVSEIQNLQIGDGEVLLDNEISLNMLFPRHFCCASIENKIVRLGFDINIILVLINGYVITENVPLNCWRS